MFPLQNEMSVTSPEASRFSLSSVTSQNQSTELSSEPGIQPSLDLPSTSQGIPPPTYLQAIQQKPIPSENHQCQTSEPPPEYTGPSPGYNSSKIRSGRFHLESTMSTAEEQERTNTMEDGIGRFIILLVDPKKYFFFRTMLVTLLEGARHHGPSPLLDLGTVFRN